MGKGAPHVVAFRDYVEVKVNPEKSDYLERMVLMEDEAHLDLLFVYL